MIPPRPPVIPPAATPVRPLPAVEVETADIGPIPVYSSTTGSTASVTAGQGLLSDDLIAEVAHSVFDVWAGTADVDELERLVQGRPNVPPAIDRILLTDLVTRSGRTEIPTWARFALLEAFWAAVAQQR